MLTRARDHWLRSNGSAGRGFSAGLSRTANFDSREPSRLRNARWFMRSRSSWMAWFSSSMEKNFRWRSAAMIQRSANCTPDSTLALSSISNYRPYRSTGRFRVTHPFHPLAGNEYVMVSRQRTWGQERVFYYDADGRLKSFSANITDLLSIDPFTRISAGRSAFRVDDLSELRELLDRHDGRAGGKQGV